MSIELASVIGFVWCLGCLVLIGYGLLREGWIRYVIILAAVAK